MHLVTISIDSIRIAHPLPFPLRDREGTLLACKGYVIPSRGDLEDISQRGGGLYIDVADSEAHHRAYVDRLHGMVRDDKPLKMIADTKISRFAFVDRQDAPEERLDWLDLQTIANFLLRDSQAATFMERLEQLQRQLARHCLRNPDGTLFALIYLSANELRMYSATHAMLVSVMCMLAAKDVLQWPEAEVQTLGLAALTMNYGMTELQDQLAVQVAPPSKEQQIHIRQHADRSAHMLAAMGIDDAHWLKAVKDHHTAAPGPLAPRDAGGRFARLIQRADMFAARLSPRVSRKPITPAMAMQGCYFDENKAIDEAGAALIKAVGICQPGSFVRLATQEIAVVIQRGQNTTTPKVAVLINRAGLPTVDPVIRETHLPEHRIVASVPHSEVKVQINLAKLLPLTALPRSDRLL